MHPILFRIPLPKSQVPAFYFYLAVMALALIYAAAMFFVRKDRKAALGGVVVAALVLGLKFARVLEKLLGDVKEGAELPTAIPIAPIPIYSYGVMLGLSLVVGWYLTLTLAEKDGLPKETMANNYVVTAVAAIAGSRILYVLTNLSEFNSPLDIFALRRGGLVAYGGFLGGFLGSLFYLRKYKIPLLPWADVAVPSLASGLMITRIGCYLFGCDFGRPLCGTAPYPDCSAAEAAPGWLQKLGTFPRWPAGLLHDGNTISEGAPAWSQHADGGLINKVTSTASLPVHPTQLYESLVGAGLLALLLVARRKQKFRGEIFLLFTFAYGVCRYLLEILRDDKERGSIPFSGGKHVMVSLGLVIFAVAFALGFSKLIKNTTMQRVAQGLAFVPAIIAYLLLAPASYGESIAYQWSTSQFVALTTGFAACVAFSVFYKAALAHPESAMRIVLPPQEGDEAIAADDSRTADADEDEEEEEAPAKKPVKKAEASAKAKAVAKADADSDADADADDEADAKAKASAKPAEKAGASAKASVGAKPKPGVKPVKKGATKKASAPKKAADEPAKAKPSDGDEDEKKADEKPKEKADESEDEKAE